MSDNYYGNEVRDFHEGARVELHPATDLWIRGARYGDVVKVGRTKVHVKLDRTGRVHRIVPALLRRVDTP
jgi:hypothetical protein